MKVQIDHRKFFPAGLKTGYIGCSFQLLDIRTRCEIIPQHDLTSQARKLDPLFIEEVGASFRIAGGAPGDIVDDIAPIRPQEPQDDIEWHVLPLSV